MLVHPAIETLRFYWQTYGGIGALLRSPYIYLAGAFTLLCRSLWTSPAPSDSAWPQIALDVIPSMLGFSMGGMAIVLAFSTAKIFKIIAEDGNEDSFFIKMMSSFFHFILIQSLAILFAVGIKAHPSIWLSGIGFWLFSYAVLVGLATAGQLLMTGKVINFAESIKEKDLFDERLRHIAESLDTISNNLDKNYNIITRTSPYLKKNTIKSKRLRS